MAGFSCVHSPLVSRATLGMKAGTGSFCAGRIFKSMGPMGLDVNTLFLITIYVEAMLGLLLLFAWVQNPGIRGVAWWGLAHLALAGSVCLFGMFGSVTDAVSIDLANALLFTAFAMTWTGARVFGGRPVLPLYLFGGAIFWVLA